MANKIKKTAKFATFIIFLLGLLGSGFFILQAKTDIFLISVSMEKNKEILPDGKIIINFSQPVIPESYEGKIELLPKEDFEISWMNNSRTLAIAPRKFWKPQMQYAVAIEEGESRFFTNIKKQSFAFSTIEYPVVESLSPIDGAKDVAIDMEEPIIVSFRESFENFYIRFNFYPATDITYQINPEKTEFKILPKKPLKDGEKYAINIFAKYIKDTDESYRQIFSSSFETLVPAPVTWEKNLGLRLEQAKKFTQAKIDQGKYIDINLSNQIMTIFDQGITLETYLVSSGKRGMETPKGTFKIENKAPRPWSKEYGLFMPNWMALVPSGKVGIHELPEWPGGYKEGQSHLGTPVSHGCVRLGVGAAKRVYDWAEIGTPVIVY
ncbi:MAG: ErfK/YbiS/YcfS/YnhG [uncultured bacterium]|nr:MAG: ErfK/YbiS/YcfS/YnhG [uncultured bacterium]HCU70432.1 hypothetical protein [Candidatus Moranbacteria bacterium]